MRRLDNRGRRGLLLALVVLAAVFPALVSASDELVRVEFRYQLPQAEETQLFWGIDGWRAVPAEIRPPGTTLDERGAMRTPMRWDGDALVARVRVPAGSKINYGFWTSRHAGRNCSLWEVDVDGSFRLDATRDEVVDVATGFLEPDGHGGNLVVQTIRYRLPGAAEVFLVTRDRREPMKRVGDRFVSRLALPEGTPIHFAFHVTVLEGGRCTDVRDGDPDSDDHYAMVAELGGTREIEADIEALDDLLTRHFVDGVRWWGFALAILISLGSPWILRFAGRGIWRFLSAVSARFAEAPETYGVSVPTVCVIAWAPFVIIVAVTIFLVLGFVGSPVARALSEDRFQTGSWNSYLFGEFGPVGASTALLFFGAGFGGLFLAWRLVRHGRMWPAAFYAVFSLALLFAGLEEAKWFQWLLGFESPEYFQREGRRGVMSLHNTRAFNKHSADVLQFIFGAGGIVGVGLGLFRRWRPVAAPAILLPWFVIIAVQAGVYRLNGIEQIGKYFDWWIRQLVEVIEMFGSMAAALYLWLNSRMLTRVRRD